MRRKVEGVKGVHGMRGGASTGAAQGVGPDDVASYEVGRTPNNPSAYSLPDLTHLCPTVDCVMQVDLR